MLVSESWLREWVDFDISTQTLSEKLTLAGLEVEAIEPVTDLNTSPGNNSKILVGEIVSTEPHPNADRLKVCQVNVGQKRHLTIVCGASNAAAGIRIPVARVGANLPKVKIEKSEIRGQTSEGMLCSAAELGLAEQSSGLMELDPSAPIGTTIYDYLNLDDQVFELSLTPNRGDCLSVQGVAREAAVLTGNQLKDIAVSPVKPTAKSSLKVSLDAPQACARFTGRVIQNIDMAAKTPDWMKEKLRRSGVRSLNLIVDITNYVMLEMGQPMHAYDLDKLQGGLSARMAKKKEKLKLLDGSEITLDTKDLVIADDKQAVGLAGIMGGDNTAISDSTRNIFFEAAFFTPEYMAGKARQFGMHTDASHRFERGVNPHGQVAAIERATALLIEAAGGKPGKVCHAQDRQSIPKRSKIKLNRTEIERILGIKIPASSINSIFKRLGMDVKSTTGGWHITPPHWRFDIGAQHDLVEEAGRCYGYEHVSPRMPASIARMGTHPETKVDIATIKNVLIANGYHEAINYSFIDPVNQQKLLEVAKGIQLANPIADNMAEMRQSLWPGLLDTLSRNLNRQESRVRLFECGHVFLKKGKKRLEINKIAGLVCGLKQPKNWRESGESVNFYDLKGDIERLLALGQGKNVEFLIEQHPALHPGQTAKLVLGKQTLGYMGQLHPQKAKMLDISQPVFLFEINLDVLTTADLPEFAPISRYPAVQRDLAVVLDKEVSARAVRDIATEAGGIYLKKLELFDIYTGERVEKDKKSFAFSLTFQSESSNLTAEEVDEDDKQDPLSTGCDGRRKTS